MEIRLDLSHHCIQTAARKKYERLLSLYWQKTTVTSEQTFLEKQIEVLKFFLEQANFMSLRSRYAVLNGGHDQLVVLSVGENLDEMKIVWHAGEANIL